MYTGRATGCRFELHRAADVVDVRMGDHNRLNAQLYGVEERQRYWRCYRPDPTTMASLVWIVAKDGAIALQHPYGQDFVN